MARKPRIEIAGGLYHIMARGNNRKRIFRSRDDYLKFLELLAKHKGKHPFYLYAYCLMPNHVQRIMSIAGIVCILVWTDRAWWISNPFCGTSGRTGGERWTFTVSL